MENILFVIICTGCSKDDVSISYLEIPENGEDLSQILSFAENDLQTIPETIINLENLERLYLKNNNINKLS